MKKLLAFLILSLITLRGLSQNKMGNSWIFGEWRSVQAKFNGVSNPVLSIKFDTTDVGFPYYLASSGSNICDGATGNLLFFSNAMRIWDSSGAVMQNGDTLQPLKIYTQNTPALQGQTQGSLILPKGSNGEYYVFIPTVSDSLYNALWTPDIKTPFDELRYNVVNMNLNGGLGAVTVKNKQLLKNTEMVRTMMQACRHANGFDWWLLKQIGYGENKIARFLITKDSIYPPIVQNFLTPNWGGWDATGQMAFSKDGKKFASVLGKGNKLFVADFDRCSGELSSPIVFNIPIDSTTNPIYDNMGSLDSISLGVCFSPNGQYIYISKAWNIYQLEYQVADSNLAWARIQHGADTTLNKFQYFGHLYRGVNDKIYIGNWGSTAKQISVIDFPNSKGFASAFCRKCFRLDTSANFAITAPPNMPDYTLGADFSKPCWPLGNDELSKLNNELKIYPNPASSKLYIETESKGVRALYNAVGQLLLTTDENEINVSQYCSGIYYIKVGNSFKKLIID